MSGVVVQVTDLLRQSAWHTCSKTDIAPQSPSVHVIVFALQEQLECDQRLFIGEKSGNQQHRVTISSGSIQQQRQRRRQQGHLEQRAQLEQGIDQARRTDVGMTGNGCQIRHVLESVWSSWAGLSCSWRGGGSAWRFPDSGDRDGEMDADLRVRRAGRGTGTASAFTALVAAVTRRRPTRRVRQDMAPQFLVRRHDVCDQLLRLGDDAACRGEAYSQLADVAHQRDVETDAVLDDGQRPVACHPRPGNVQRHRRTGNVGDDHVGYWRDGVGDSRLAVH